MGPYIGGTDIHEGFEPQCVKSFALVLIAWHIKLGVNGVSWASHFLFVGLRGLLFPRRRAKLSR